MGSRTWRVERRIRHATAGLDVVKLVGGLVVVFMKNRKRLKHSDFEKKQENLCRGRYQEQVLRGRQERHSGRCPGHHCPPSRLHSASSCRS